MILTADSIQIRSAPQPTSTTAADTAAPASVIAPSQATPSQQLRQLLDAHNRYRAKHSAGPLTWSADVASTAESFVARCDFQYDDPASTNLGQNLFLTTSKDVTAAVDAATRYW